MESASKKDTLGNQYADSGNLDARASLHARFSTNPYGWTRWLFDQVPFHEGCRVLEVGCGTGSFWSLNMDRVHPSWQIVLTDISAGMLLAAKHQIQAGNFAFETADIQNIPFKDDSFDIVLANHMLYHVPDRHQALQEASRVLRNAGRLYASTLGIRNMKELADLVNNFYKEAIYPDTKDVIGFNLENGRQALSEWFEEVELRRYEDSLVVTEAKPLIDYVKSLQGFGNISRLCTDDGLRQFQKYIAEILQREGSIRITKDAGLFAAGKKKTNSKEFQRNLI